VLPQILHVQKWIRFRGHPDIAARPPKEVFSPHFSGDQEVKKPTTNEKLIFNHFLNNFCLEFFAQLYLLLQGGYSSFEDEKKLLSL
jgi:hypothetical protein